MTASHPTRNIWSQNEIDRLRAMSAAGKTPAEIAAAIPGRSAGACATKINDLRLRGRQKAATGPSWGQGLTARVQVANLPGSTRRSLEALLALNERRYRQAAAGRGAWADPEMDEADLMADLEHLRGCCAAVRARLAS